MDNLDIREFNEQNDALKVAIVNAVNDTQRLIQQPLPSKITMNKHQYQMLQGDKMMMHAFNSKDHLYRTPLNVMEVIIKT